MNEIALRHRTGRLGLSEGAAIRRPEDRRTNHHRTAWQDGQVRAGTGEEPLSVEEEPLTQIRVEALHALEQMSIPACAGGAHRGADLQSRIRT